MSLKLSPNLSCKSSAKISYSPKLKFASKQLSVSLFLLPFVGSLLLKVSEAKAVPTGSQYDAAEFNGSIRSEAPSAGIDLVKGGSEQNTQDAEDTEELDSATFLDEPNSLSSWAAPDGVLVVKSSRHSKEEALNNDFVSSEQIALSPSSITELLSYQQGLSSNGQPGLFQTLNIRGLARQRVHAYINGMRITSERRAGVAASFVDPLLLAGAEVTQGPSSTYYGSGALAGSIHLITKSASDLWGSAGFSNDGNEWVTAVGIGNEDYSASLAYRTRNNGETVTGEAKNNQYSQHSLNYVHQFKLGRYNLEWQFIESRGNDLGKDNLRFPDSRITSYPEEQHLLSQVTLSSDTDWSARLYFHDQSLITRDLRPANRINQVETDSLDIGFSLEDQWQAGEWGGLMGLDYFGRRGVDSLETETDLQTDSNTSFKALDNGRENETAIFVTANRQFDEWSLHSGVRWNTQSQSSDQSESISDQFATYFVTAKKQWGDWDFSVNYGTGFRFASLSERLFSGTTGRGQTIGNPDLKPEESRAIDFGIGYRVEQLRIQAHWFKTEIDDFIERISIADDTRTYDNVTAGDIDGWQYELTLFPQSELSFEVAGQIIDGTDSDNATLADIPPNRHRVSVSFHHQDWHSQLDFVRRMEKDDFGDGEIALDAANLVTLKAAYNLSAHWRLQLSIENLLDEEYFGSADDLSTLESGRTFGINVFYN